MSQTETVMLVAFGFALASIFALFACRLTFHIGVRVGSRRVQRQVPTTLAELKTDRDRLRAENAMLARRLEVRLDELNARLAERSAELTRYRNRVDEAIAEIKKRDESIKTDEEALRLLREQTSHLESELAQRTETIQELRQQLQSKEEESARFASQIGGLNEVIAGYESRFAAASAEAQPIPAGEDAAERLRRRIDTLTSLSLEIAEQRAQFNRERTELRALSGAGEPAATLPTPSGEKLARLGDVAAQSRTIETKLAEAERETTELAAEMERLDRAWSEQFTRRPAQDAAPPRAVEPAPPAEPAPPPPVPPDNPAPPRALANVVSLANRIRSLQKDITG